MTDQELIEKWLAQNGGARKFENGLEITESYLRSFLETRGYSLKKKGFYFCVSSPDHSKSKRYTKKQLVCIVDEIRMSEGNPPIMAGFDKGQPIQIAKSKRTPLLKGAPKHQRIVKNYTGTKNEQLKTRCYHE